eukprot:SAG22_NODE_106_length_19904_cov_14.387175_16_plen_53_part_00
MDAMEIWNFLDSGYVAAGFFVFVVICAFGAAHHMDNQGGFNRAGALRAKAKE